MFPPKFNWYVLVESHATVFKQSGQHSVNDGCTDLGFDVVTDDRKATVRESLLPVALSGNENRDAVHESTTGGEDLLDVPLGCLLGANREVVDNYVDFSVAQDAYDVGRLARGFIDDFVKELADAIVGHPTVDFHAHMRDFVKLDGVVVLRNEGIRKIFADFFFVDVEGCNNVHITQCVPAENVVHQARDVVRAFVDFAVFVESLYQR